jgi:ATP synthase protein I
VTEQSPDTAAPQPARRRHADSVRTLAAAMLRTGVVFSAVATLAALAVAAAAAGWPGVYGAAVGAAVGLVSSLLTIAMMWASAPLPVESLFGVVMGGYTVKIFALLVVAFPLRQVEAIHPMSLALTVLVVVVAWAAAEVVAFRRTRIPTIIPDGW